MKDKKLKTLSVKDYSGYIPNKKITPVIKRKHYFLVTDRVIAGDAPKDLIRLYNYQEGQHRQKTNWDLYIVKHGHKHYPNESITEYLLNKIGDVLGFNMSISQLGFIAGQIRFFSKYFLSNPDHQTLNHGADLYAGFIHDKDLIEEIEQNKLSADLFTIQFTKDTLNNFFGSNADTIFINFLEMLLFDAIVGNNDRHFYNWGVVTDLRGSSDPYFAPIYDTARGLYWNDHEDKLIKMFQSKSQLNQKIATYSKNSKPKIGWEGKTKLNHFELIDLTKDIPLLSETDTFSKHLSTDKLVEVEQMIENEFKHLLTPIRIELIIKTLSYRFTILRKITNFAP